MRRANLNSTRKSKAFTIVELLIVIVVIGILAVIVSVAYTGVQKGARDKSVSSDVDELDGIETQYGIVHHNGGLAWYSGNGVDPTLNFTPSTGNVIDIVVNTTDYCIRAYNPGSKYATLATALTKESTTGTCASLPASSAAQSGGGGGGGGGIADGSSIQTITSSNCPSTRTRAVDTRDNHTYWVQKLSDGKCWMLTNLAYAGGGTNTYSDTMTLSNGTSDMTTTVTTAKYYVLTGSNPTSEPTSPSSATTGLGQYGYLYNWCAAMGGQTSTSACAYTATPTPSTSISVCPFGWRLPSATSNDFNTLNASVNGGSTSTDAGLRTGWLGQYGGYRTGAGIAYQNQGGYYWTSTQYSATYPHYMRFESGATLTDDFDDDSDDKGAGFAVRCIAL